MPNTVNIYDIAATWNNAAVAFTAIKMNVTDTASHADSKLMDLQVGGEDRAYVTKNAQLFLRKPTAPPTSLQASALIKLQAPVNETGSRFISFHGPSLINEEGFICSFAGHTGVIFNGSSFDASQRVTVGYSSATGVWLSTVGLNLAVNSSIAFTSNRPFDTKDVYLLRDAANTLALRNSTNPQNFNIYNTYTDASNYERGFMRWNANVFEIGTKAAGTGVERVLRLLNSSTGFDILNTSGNSVIRAINSSGGIDYAWYQGINHRFFTNTSHTTEKLLIDHEGVKVGNVYDSDFVAFANGGNILIRTDWGNARVSMPNLPTADPIVVGQVWNLGGSLVLSDEAAFEGFTRAQGFKQTTLTDAANIDWDLDLNQTTVVTLTDNRTLNNPTNMRAGFTYVLVVKQDATGSRTLAFGNAYKFAEGVVPTLSTDANAVDILTFICDGTAMYGVASKNFA